MNRVISTVLMTTAGAAAGVIGTHEVLNYSASSKAQDRVERCKDGQDMSTSASGVLECAGVAVVPTGSDTANSRAVIDWPKTEAKIAESIRALPKAEEIFYYAWGASGAAFILGAIPTTIPSERERRAELLGRTRLPVSIEA